MQPLYLMTISFNIYRIFVLGFSHPLCVHHRGGSYSVLPHTVCAAVFYRYHAQLLGPSTVTALSPTPPITVITWCLWNTFSLTLLFLGPRGRNNVWVLTCISGVGEFILGVFFVCFLVLGQIVIFFCSLGQFFRAYSKVAELGSSIVCSLSLRCSIEKQITGGGDRSPLCSDKRFTCLLRFRWQVYKLWFGLQGWAWQI